jgi:hypothetical protein
MIESQHSIGSSVEVKVILCAQLLGCLELFREMEMGSVAHRFARLSFKGACRNRPKLLAHSTDIPIKIR